MFFPRFHTVRVASVFDCAIVSKYKVEVGAIEENESDLRKEK